MSSTSRTPGAIVVAKSIAPKRSSTPPARPEFVEQLQVLQQRGLGVDGQPDDLAALAPPATRTSVVGSGGTSKVWLMPWRPSTSASSTRFPAAGQRDGQGRGDRRLAGAALAGDDVQPHTGEAVGAQRVGGGRHTPNVCRRALPGCRPARAWPSCQPPTGEERGSRR
jgi:hypothetical protein